MNVADVGASYQKECGMLYIIDPLLDDDMEGFAEELTLLFDAEHALVASHARQLCLKSRSIAFRCSPIECPLEQAKKAEHLLQDAVSAWKEYRLSNSERPIPERVSDYFSNIEARLEDVRKEIQLFESSNANELV